MMAMGNDADKQRFVRPPSTARKSGASYSANRPAAPTSPASRTRAVQATATTG